jgi:hypothetical protein
MASKVKANTQICALFLSYHLSYSVHFILLQTTGKLFWVHISFVTIVNEVEMDDKRGIRFERIELPA